MPLDEGESMTMNIKLGTSDAREFLFQLGLMFRNLKPQIERLDLRAGLFVFIVPAEPQSSPEQRKGFHALLDDWWSMDPGVAVDTEALKDKVCRAMWGVCRIETKHGKEAFVTARRTTRKWDVDLKKYVPAPLSKADYSALIDFTYRMAADDGVVLPDNEKAA